MLKWILIGCLCAAYCLLLEPRVLQLISELRDVVALLRRSRRPQPAAPPRSEVQVFTGGAVAALIVVFWPLYLVALAGKLLGFTAGLKHKETDDARPVP